MQFPGADETEENQSQSWFWYYKQNSILVVMDGIKFGICRFYAQNSIKQYS